MLLGIQDAGVVSEVLPKAPPAASDTHDNDIYSSLMQGNRQFNHVLPDRLVRRDVTEQFAR